MAIQQSLLYKVWHYVVQIIVAALLEFALSGVIIFVLHGLKISPINPDEPGVFLALYFTLLDAVINVTLVNVYIQYVKFPKKTLQNHLLLSLLLVIARRLVDPIDFLNFPGYRIEELWEFGFFDMLFAGSNIFVGNLIYVFLIQEQTRIRKISEQEYQLLILKELKTKAELEALQAKINPHFLYNALNSIASLVHIDPDKAEKMVLLLAKFFRYSTSVKHEYLNTLAGEIEMVQTYLEVEKVRFDDRLEYSIEFSDESLKEYLSPRFLLQPLVENAIKHGISKLGDTGVIDIKIHKHGKDHVVIIIHDNGKPFPENIHPGYGLQSTQDKIRLFYGEKASFEIKNGDYKHLKICLPVDKPIQTGTDNLIKLSEA